MKPVARHSAILCSLEVFWNAVAVCKLPEFGHISSFLPVLDIELDAANFGIYRRQSVWLVAQSCESCCDGESFRLIEEVKVLQAVPVELLLYAVVVALPQNQKLGSGVHEQQNTENEADDPTCACLETDTVIRKGKEKVPLTDVKHDQTVTAATS